MADDGDEDEESGGRVEAEGEADPEAVDEAVDGEAERSEDPDPLVGARLLWVVAVVQHERPLGEEEGEEADRHEGRRPARVADVSIPSGRTSKRATATTIPPVRAIRVGREW